MEHPDPRCRPAGEGHQRDEQQEEGHQDVDGGGGALHSGLAAAPAVRRPEPDGSSDQHVGMTTTGLTLTLGPQVPLHQHHLVLLPLAGHVQQLIQPLHLPALQCESDSLGCSPLNRRGEDKWKLELETGHII